jgi:phosphate transport system permease protein
MAITKDMQVRRAEATQPPASVAYAYRKRRTDLYYHGVTLLVALVLLGVLITIIVVMFTTAWPALGKLGLGFLTGTDWNTALNSYGAWPFLAGTGITTVLALVIALPLSIAISILLTEYAPPRLASIAGVVIDVAAGVPTIVFGAWALLALVPWLRDTAEPALTAALGWIPIFSVPPIGYVTGQGMFATGIVLAAMIFPTIVAVTRNSFLAVPRELREVALGLGATRWETATGVVLRQARPALLGAAVLGCGRALGEAMAVIYIIGSVTQLPHSLFDVGNTIAAQLLTQVGGAIPGSLNTAALYELGIVLLVLSLCTSLAGRLLTARLAGVAAITGGGGR